MPPPLRSLLLAGLCLALSSPEAGAQEGANRFAAAMAAFQQRVKDYVSLRSRVAGTLPEVKETGDLNQISTRERDLGAAIARERRDAKAGDIFGEVTPHLQRIVAKDWNRRSKADRDALLEEIPPGLKLFVNQPYPTTIPLVTVPARLLADLPTLPEEVEYRFVDRRLLLRDRDANLIVDVLVGISPTRSR